MCNLYPFVKTVSKEDCTVEAAVEEIDIGKYIIYFFQHTLLPKLQADLCRCRLNGWLHDFS